MSRDFQYREDIAQLSATNREWMAQLPVGDMIRFGWLGPVPHPSDELEACLRFFGVDSIRGWRKAYATIQEAIAFRTSPTFDSRLGAVAAWLRQGELEGRPKECAPWNAAGFQASLPKLRSLTRRKDPRVFVPRLRECCAENGVAVSVVRAPTGCRASGATRFLSTDRALLLLSFRYLTDDHFWFTFFHECGHLLLHGEQELFLEGTDTKFAAEEQEANEFAAHTLIPVELQPALFIGSAARLASGDPIRKAGWCVPGRYRRANAAPSQNPSQPVEQPQEEVQLARIGSSAERYEFQRALLPVA